MAIEVGLQARLARQKLKTNLVLLNNASVRVAEKVRVKKSKARLYKSNPEASYNPENWLSTYISLGILFALFLVCLTIKY